MTEMATTERKKWNEAVLSVLTGTQTKTDTVKVKKLRKLVLLSLQLDDTDKAARKTFKQTIQALEKDGGVKLDAEGTVTLVPSKQPKKRKHKDDAPKPKRTKIDSVADATDETNEANETNETNQNERDDTKDADKNAPCRGNPQGVTRLFLGNLPFAVDETILGDFMPGLTHVKWITDKETGKFYGSAFIELQTSAFAASAVAKAGQELLGRAVKINFAPALPGDAWPPDKRVVTGGQRDANSKTSTTTLKAGGVGLQALAAKPADCVKLFMGNLSYDIDDDGITKFFASVDAEVKAVRWIHHKDTGDFKGVGFVEFWNTEACERAAALNGKNLLGRPIRIDWTD